MNQPIPMDPNVMIWGIPHWVTRPPAGKIGVTDQQWFECTYKGNVAYTDGRIADLRQPQYNDFLMRLNPERSTIGTGRRLDLAQAIPPFSLRQLALINTKTVFTDGKKKEEFLFLGDGERVAAINPYYYDYFKYFYPEATFHVSILTPNEQAPAVVVQEGGETVGCIMGMRLDERDMKRAVEGQAI
jgi:hypothetical protein